jgi:hypothetical protein
VEKVGAVQWDLAPDGRIVAAVPVPAQPGAAPPGEHHVVYLQNFFDEVKRKSNSPRSVRLHVGAGFMPAFNHQNEFSV